MAYYSSPGPSQPQQPLQFYSSADQNGYYMEPHHGLQGNVTPGQASAYGGTMHAMEGGWLAAFGTGGFEGESPLLEELGINFSHIRAKSLTVLNPLQRIDEHIMDDADLAGPIVFSFCFGAFLFASGRSQFGYIYGLALLGSLSIYVLLNLMSEKPIDVYRTASVLGYCLLPMVGVGALSVMLVLEKSWMGLILSILSIFWCTYSASGIFVAVLNMSEQRLLVAYPVGLLYGCFALLSVFRASKGSLFG